MFVHVLSDAIKDAITRIRKFVDATMKVFP